MTCELLKDKSATLIIPDILNFRKPTNSDSVSCPSTFGFFLFLFFTNRDQCHIAFYISFFFLMLPKPKVAFFSLYFATLQYLCVGFFFSP